MRSVLAVAILIVLSVVKAAAGQTNVSGFENAKPGSVPPGWSAGVTGSGNPDWSVMEDRTAPSPGHVLAQIGSGTYPICVLDSVALAEGFVEVKFKPISGRIDQAGGLIWRFQEKDNDYIVRANALEDNVTIYHTVKGLRQQFKNARVRVAGGTWHTLRAEFQGSSCEVFFDGKSVLKAEDKTFSTPGAVGVWTKADSRTFFDDFEYGLLSAK